MDIVGVQLDLNNAEEAPRMFKAASRKISIFLAGFILLTWAAIAPPSLCVAGMNELSDAELSSIHATGLSSFDLNTTTGIARIDLNTVTLKTYTEINSLKMGYYGSPKAWDQEWSGVSLGSSTTNTLDFNGLFIEAKFTDITNGSGNRQLEYLRIGTPKLTGTISANFKSFSGDIGAANYSRSNLGAVTITSPGTGADKSFYISLDRLGGYTFHFGSDSHL